MRAKITKRLVDAAVSAKGDAFVWDSETRGFGLKVTARGRKIYVLQYRVMGGPTQRFTIGRHGAPWTPDLARLKAKELLGFVARGQDPAAARRAVRDDITIAELCDLYLAEGVRAKKASTVLMDRSRIDRHVKPLLGRRQVKAVTRPEIERFLTDVTSGRTRADVRTKPRGRAIVRGGEAAANRVQDMLGTIFEFAIRRDLRADNPVRGVRKNKSRKIERFLSNSELTRLGEALRAAEARGVNSRAISAIRLLMLTGCRKSEVLKLRWSEVDLEGGFLRLKDSKTGPKTIHLAEAAKDVLHQMPIELGNPFVFPGDGGVGHLVGLQRIWKSVRTSAALSDVRIHDLRHTYASIGARSGESLLILGKVLGHATTSSTARYAHLSDDPVRSANGRIAAEIAHHLGLRPAA